MSHHSNEKVIDYDQFVKDPLGFIEKYPHQFLLLKKGKKLKSVDVPAALYEHVIEKLSIDWSKK
jgi:hypothetical protein